MCNQNGYRGLGLIGILGGLVLFAGDMLFYFDVMVTDFDLNMGNASDSRIKLSGVSALIGVWCYCLGLIHVQRAFQNSTQLMRNLIMVCFAGILISYGVVHAAYVAIAVSAKLSVTHGLDMDTTTALAKEANRWLRLIIYPVFGLLSVLFIKEIWQKKTLYPRWIILFFPLIPFLLKGVVNLIVSGTVKTIVMGGYLNLLLVLFFIGSSIALWSTKKIDDNQV